MHIFVLFFVHVFTFVHEDELNFPLKKVKIKRDDSAFTSVSDTTVKSVVIMRIPLHSPPVTWMLMLNF